MKTVRRLAALVTLMVVAVKGALSFLSWVEKQEEVQAVWVEDDDREDAF